MGDDLDFRPVNRKSGIEQFHSNGKPLNFDLLGFWQWAASDLLSNVSRGILAEYLVAYDLGIVGGVREEWAAYDMKTSSGISVEVKSAAYLQRWHQNRLSSITFSIAPTYAWDAATNQSSLKRTRQADVYVFCLLNHKDKSTVDSMNVEQWEFYILPTLVLNERLGVQKHVTLKRLKQLEPIHVRFGQIRSTIENLF